jgi:hypothetical protein
MEYHRTIGWDWEEIANLCWCERLCFPLVLVLHGLGFLLDFCIDLLHLGPLY